MTSAKLWFMTSTSNPISFTRSPGGMLGFMVCVMLFSSLLNTDSWLSTTKKCPTVTRPAMWMSGEMYNSSGVGWDYPEITTNWILLPYYNGINAKASLGHCLGVHDLAHTHPLIIVSFLMVRAFRPCWNHALSLSQLFLLEQNLTSKWIVHMPSDNMPTDNIQL